MLDDFVVKEDDPLAYATLPVPNETLNKTFCNRPTGQPYRKGDPYRRETQVLEMQVVQLGIYLLIWYVSGSKLSIHASKEALVLRGSTFANGNKLDELGQGRAIRDSLVCRSR